jgi:hemerythrin
MSKFVWHESYGLHIKQIDDQHKRLISTIGKLSDAITDQRVKQELVGIFDEIFEYTKIHFATEEKYFDEFKYEGAREHIAAHRGFTGKAENLHKRMHEDNKFQISLELVAMLEMWLADHLITMDKKYEKCFHEHGLR